MAIRTKFLLVFLFTSIVPLVILAGFMFSASRATVIGKTKDNIQTVALSKESIADLLIGDYAKQATLVANRVVLLSLVEKFNKTNDAGVQQEIYEHLLVVQKTIGETQTISVIGADDTVISSTDTSQVGKNQGTPSTAAELLIDSNSLVSTVIRQPLLVNSMPIGTLQFVDRGTLLGTITADLTAIGKTGDVLFVKDNAGGAPTVSESRFKEDDPKQTALHAQLADPKLSQLIKARKSGSGESNDGSFFYTIKHLEQYDVSLVIKIDNSEVLASVNPLRDNIIVFSLIFILLVIMTILFFVHSLAAPIANLSAVARKTALGDLTDRAMVLSRDEIGNLATSFNHMLDELQKLKNTLEDKVLERTKQLEASNKELEAFSYSVSHDLRAPLRSIDGFSKILTEDYADKMGDDGKRIISIIAASTQQMGRLIDDLLAFSRLGRQEVKKQELGMKPLVEEVVAEQLALNPGRKIKLDINNLPNAYADAMLIRQVWANLLSNAIKFTRKTPSASIEVGYDDDVKTTTYYVKDNGAGFNMAYIDKLFGVFQRLHDQKDFEGTGVGLALVKRIIERQGGKVWAEGQVDKGATIYFELPKLTHKKEKA